MVDPNVEYLLEPIFDNSAPSPGTWTRPFPMQALARLMPHHSGQDVTAKAAKGVPQGQDFVGNLAGHSRRISAPWVMAGLAGLACLAAAGFLLIRRR
ncbi:MAG: hypothetical protein A3J74_02180 [Elusimicrobia bacterium RIFCSPHIGHO2_02_FULL_57_9]|nr:MAG: hypothetical protein A3J74_02180 [Elusimicrobia bacterium RIFCSPHIGHO2_02_FULL_57_9]